jgi:hypothetical protein
MKKPRRKKPKSGWKDPVKGVPAKDSTMRTEGNFAQFTEIMKRVMRLGKPTSASPGHAAS